MHRKLEGPEGSSGHGGKEESLPYWELKVHNYYIVEGLGIWLYEMDVPAREFYL
jgi:hypothetical protein